MSCNVLIIPEDPTYDGAILNPLVCRILKKCRKANANVSVLRNPKVAGFEHACGRMPQIVRGFRHFNLLLFMVDADGRDRSAQFKHLESEAATEGVNLICCAAKEEIEVWLLAGHVAKREWPTVRSDISVKENVFAPFLRQHGDANSPDGGREILMKKTLTNYQGLLKRCPELADLQDRICRSLGATPNS